MPLYDAWVRSVPDDVSDRARAAWARSDWATVTDELVVLAAQRGDARVLSPVFAAEVQLLDRSYLAPHASTIEQLPPAPMRDAALAFLAIRSHLDERDTAPARSAVTALFRDDPALAAALASGVATVLADRGRWAEGAWFVDAARSGVDAVRGTDAPSSVIEELWFRMMAVAVLVEWNTYEGSEAFEELSAALVVPRARNLLRAHHAPALISIGQVLAARGQFGAGAVSIARGVPLLPDRSAMRASAQARLALVKYRQGDWRGARRAASRVCDLDESAVPSVAGLVSAVATLEPAVGGDFSTARTRVDDAGRILAAQPSVLAETVLLHSRIALAIGSNDWTGMIQLLDDAEEPGYRRVYTDHEWRALWGMALRNAGRVDRYRALVGEWEHADGGAQHPYYWAHVSLLAQIDADGPRALHAARRARELTGDGEDPLGRTWARIVVGTIVSLYGDPTEGMESYEAARAELVEMGADGFVRLCTRIIEGTAAQLAAISGDALNALTAQQRRVAELVAEGYTSAEIGQILYLSKKTIDFHVANIVSRLGLASRRELKRRMAAVS